MLPGLPQYPNSWPLAQSGGYMGRDFEYFGIPGTFIVVAGAAITPSFGNF